jgi:subtilisin family serine protease
MDTQIEQQIAAVGHANVLLALSPGVIEAAKGAAAAGAAYEDLEQYFVQPDPQQTVALEVASTRSMRRRIKTPAAVERPKVRIYPRLGLALGFVDATGAAALSRNTKVAAMHAILGLSLIRPVSVAAAGAREKPTWGIELLKVPTLWDNGYDGKGVIVGHLDTGVDGSHPALKGAIAAFAEFDFAGDEVARAKPRDSGEHGTHTAGTIGGRPVPRGTFGVAPGAKLASALVIEGGQVNARILAGLEWILSRNARILSMSLGLRGYTPAFETLIDSLRRNNVLPVIAVGNEGPDSSRSPGNYDKVLSVGAFASDETVADFSSSQKFARAHDRFVPDLVAPGVDILSCIPNGRYARMDGSSMATPHIAGLAALLLQAKPEATADELESAILGSCKRPTTMPDYRANRGVPDAVQALKLLTGKDLTAEVAAAERPRARRATARPPTKTAQRQGRKKKVA